MTKKFGIFALLAASSALAINVNAENITYSYTPTANLTADWTTIAWTGSDSNTYTWADISTDNVSDKTFTYNGISVTGGIGAQNITFSADTSLNGSLTITPKTNRTFFFNGATASTNLHIENLNVTNNDAAKKTRFSNMNLSIGTFNSIMGGIGFGVYANGGGCNYSLSLSKLTSATIDNWNITGGLPEVRSTQLIYADSFVVKNLITASSVPTSSFLALVNGTNMSVGGLSGGLNMTVQSNLDGKSSIIELKNTDSSTNSGIIKQSHNYDDGIYGNFTNVKNDATMAFKMNAANASGAQLLTSSSLFFTGGITVLNGTFGVNFDQSTVDYHYKSAFKTGAAATGTYTWTDFTRTDYVLTKTSSEDDVVTTASHGDLIMEGGVFSNTRTNGSDTQSFRFTNINYSGGTIKLEMYDSEYDFLDITNGYYVRTSQATHATGSSSKITYSAYAYSDAVVAGGKITIAEGTQMTFDLSGNLSFLLKTEESADDFIGTKIIAWTAGAADGYDSSDFSAGGVKDIDGVLANAIFTLQDDGLYVMYVAVPEPAEWAAIFGALALAFVAYRRRK